MIEIVNQITIPDFNVDGTYKLSADKIAMMVIALLVYAKGKFQLMDVLGIKQAM